MMTPRERVAAVFNRTCPDRTPLDFCNSAGFINDPAYFALRKLLAINEDIPPFRKGFTANYYDERVLEKLNIDFRHVWLKPPSSFTPAFAEDGSYRDEWGIRYRFLGNERAIMENPLADAGIDDLKTYPWPDPFAAGRTDGVGERALYLQKETSYAVGAHAAQSLGFFDNGWILRGFENFMVDLMTDDGFADALLHRLLEIYLGFYQVYLDAVDGSIDMIAHCEDFGMQGAPFMSPDLYRKYFFPLHKELFSFIKKRSPGVKIMFHSCGAIRPLIPMMIEAGVDVLNPIQPTAAGMDSRELKKEFGSELVFHGGIDIQYALIGSVQDVANEAKERIEALGRGGGYILAPANLVQGETPPENIKTLYDTAVQYRL